MENKVKLFCMLCLQNVPHLISYETRSTHPVSNKGVVSAENRLKRNNNNKKELSYMCCACTYQYCFNLAPIS